MLFTRPVEYQPDFPKEDLTETNADILSMVLRNRQELRGGHAAAESAAMIYKVGHKAFRTAFDRLYENNTVIKGFDMGIATYEAISSFVSHPPVASAEVPLILGAHRIAQSVSALHFDEYVEAAAQSIVYATPRTVEVVAEVAHGYSGSPQLAHLAVLGAGMARKFELDNMDIVNG